ncbi:MULTISPECIES: phosphoserine phosphatase SerB [unclassified Methylophaga]|jgi:phosphoserine phosphatase|uniref:phosphoserine phosphatase SerB n=1 Tax=unclassified Methylophaga TaxID=2629249 RepID=UPI000C982F42|nr:MULTISPECIES: phosphoserine phosphatase SerB [unclassified Methylophaga]MAK66568.1 phosphoserine phosphatase SerB [Methylophaga sp.]MAY17553.1 phosphoserine phosphatase SerB [Methylophaga sp.]|tara:strand:+ start:42144 stop:42974 length:831 start_codon:yes stop_codon:yes gene_type:complete
MTQIIVQGPQLTHELANDIAEKLAGNCRWQNRYALIENTQHADLTMLRQQFPVDINVLPANFVADDCRLIVMDMDSTLINIECIDEIADFMDLKPQVAAITEAAMRGEIDFETSLKKRVALLKGLPVDMLDRVYNERLMLNPGAELMLKTVQQAGMKTALVSGGFTFFTDKLKKRLNLDFTQANVLAEANGLLTGEVKGAICGAQAKADFLIKCCADLGIENSQSIAIGDGANDLLMMAEAGMSVAYHAKPKVQEVADTTFNFCGLDGVLGLLQRS